MEEERPQIRMGKVVVSKTSCLLSFAVFVLMCACVGLLVILLRGAKDLESSDNHLAPPDYQEDAPTTELERDPWQYYRLPSYIVPLHYDLLMKPNLTTDIFTGTANITVDVSQNTKYFIVHIRGLNVLQSRVFDVKSDSETGIEKSFSYANYEYFVVETNDTVEPGVYKLNFEFMGSLVGKFVGYYKSWYRNSKNETRYLATTKFEPTYAREAFPCFDEPIFKSTFNISVIHEDNYTAVSNMPVESIESYGTENLLVTKFQKSVPMVTYLACFIVSDFRYLAAETSKGKQFRVYSSPELVNTTSYALQMGTEILNFFEDYFGIDYPLPKQDMIAIPHLWSAAMENWGIITFKEPALLFDPENSSPRSKQQITAVIAHEMAHMWFGNLVTLKWWNDLWLNEGFASYIEYKGVQATHPEWDILSQFLVEDLQVVMDIDASTRSRPIVKKVSDPGEIFKLFDRISYKKGASILRMLEFCIGSEEFRSSITKYLQKHKYDNAVTADLWEEFSDIPDHQGNRSTSSIMKLWTEQMGYPCITVSRKAENSSIFTFKQKRFLKKPHYYRSSSDYAEEVIWSVPMSYITSDGKSGLYWLHEKEGEQMLPVDNSKWVKFNINQTGYYIVNYEETEWKRLTELLLTNHEELSPTDRSNLLFDSFHLSEAGILNISTFLSISKYLKNETHFVPWKTAYEIFMKIVLLQRDDVKYMFQGYIKDLTRELYEILKWNVSSNHLENLMRSIIIDLACHAGNKACLFHAADLYQQWKSEQNVHPAVRYMMFRYGLAEKGENEWKILLNNKSEPSPFRRKDYSAGLSSVIKPSVIQKYLELSLDENKVGREEFFENLEDISSNPVGKTLAFNFIRDNWKTLSKRYDPQDGKLGNSVRKVTSSFSTEDELNEVKKFFNRHLSARVHYQVVIEDIEENIVWRKTHTDNLKSWLKNEGSAMWYHYQLPTHIIPQHYDLTLFPMLDGDIFNGSVSISVVLQKPSDCFLVHALELEIFKVEVVDFKGGRLVEVDDVFRFREYDYLVVKVREKLPSGFYKLNFEFQGQLTLSLRGLYKSSYLDPIKNERRYLATTQFEAVEARRAFPCFDEPRYKATFQVTVIHDSNHYALSNTMVENTTELEGGLRKTVFEKSPPMVTYLVSINICDFKFKEIFTESGVRIRVYAAPHHYENIDYSLELGSRILTFFEVYFGIPFPLKKLDMIAVPDFKANGMENWGLISFSERSLITKNPPSIAAKKHMSAIIAHELAHMWFGDLVSIAWWDDLWLNEGFATYMSQKGVQKVEPDFDKENFEGISRLLIAMRNDQTVNSHAIVPSVTIVTNEIFDAITYSKGSSVLRMLENYMGDDFREGVSDYLKKYSFDYAKTEHLWEKLSENSRKGLNVSSIMHTWTTQANYPYVSVRRDMRHEDYYIVQQHQYMRSVDPNGLLYSSSTKCVWQVPLSYFTSENKMVSYILLNSTEEVRLHIPNSKWIKFNAGLAGYYSVNYELKIWKELILLLQNNPTALSPSDRINLVFDAFSLASAGHLNYQVPLNLTRYVKDETYYGAWNVVLQELLNIKWLFRETHGEIQDSVQEYIRTLSKDLLLKYSWNETGSYADRMLRNTLIGAACESGEKHCLDTASHLFKKWMNGENLDIDIREVVYTYGLRAEESEELWNFILERCLLENELYERERLRNSLTKVQNSTLINRLINFSLDESLVRKHEYFQVLQQIALNSKEGFNLVTHRIFNEWNDLIKLHGKERSLSFVSEIFCLFTTEEELKKVEEFYDENVTSNTSIRARTKAIDSINLNINWLKKHNETVRNWFQSTVYMPWNRSRLPDHILPLKYDLTLHPNLTQSTTEGEVSIDLNVSDATDYIVLHAKGLRIEETEVTESGKVILIEDEFQYKKNEFYVILLRESIQPGIYILRMKFSGIFASNGEGIGLYDYIDVGANQKRYLAATRFQGTYARKVFPCFDEPNKKAKFHLTVKHDASYKAVSNMPVKEVLNLDTNLVNTVFEESVHMSTYLLFFIISDFGYIEEIHNEKPIRVYAPVDQLENAVLGLKVTVKLLKDFEEYFNIPYALPKLDSVLIPNYGVPGMEHWGVLTYEPDRFLIYENMTTYKRIVHVEKVISHEIAHQWIGNLITLEWWDDLWMNEGLATLIQYIPLKKYYSSINQIDVTKKAREMCTDSTTDSHPIVRNVTTIQEIKEAFDSITYIKGAAIIKMLQHVLKDDFRTGLRNFLREHSFKTARAENLWTQLMNSTNKDVDVSRMMYTWTHQMGFPYIEIGREDNNVSATQHWFLSNSIPLKEIENHPSRLGYIWEVPLTFKNLDSGDENLLWLKTKEGTFQTNTSHQDVLKFNTDFNGFYIVKYDTKDWAKLGQRLLQRHEDFSIPDRYNLLHDSFILADSSLLSYDIPLQLTKYLSRERESSIWNFFRDQYLYILRHLDSDSEAIKLIKEYTNKLTSDLYDDYVHALPQKKYFKNWNSLPSSCSYTDVELDFLAVIVDLACRTSNPKCVKLMEEELQQWLQGEKISSDISFVLDIAIPYFGNDTLWDFMYDALKSNNSKEETLVYLEGLTRFRDPSLIQKTIEFMAFDPSLSKDLTIYLFNELSKNPVAFPLLWDFTRHNFHIMHERLDDEYHFFTSLSPFCKKSNSKRYVHEMKFLFETSETLSEIKDAGKRECMNRIISKINWNLKFEKTITTWLLWNSS